MNARLVILDREGQISWTLDAKSFCIINHKSCRLVESAAKSAKNLAEKLGIQITKADYHDISGCYGLTL